MPASKQVVKNRVRDFEFRKLFVQELGWDKPGAPVSVPHDGREYLFAPVAQKRGMQVFECTAPGGESVPDRPTRLRLERKLSASAYEHVVVFTDAARTQQVWLWVKREAGSADRPREEDYSHGDGGERLAQKLLALAFTLAEEDKVELADVRARTRKALDVERVTKRFFDRFQAEHAKFVALIQGIGDESDRAWYASLTLNRLMFVYFIQKKGFLAGDTDYLRTKLREVQQSRGRDEFAAFYRHFLRRLFHEGLGQKKAERARDLDALLGDVPYLNGGLFEVHELERTYPDIRVPDSAFEALFAFFDAYTWHLDHRPLRADNEINPDVLGYIFEKYINQKQMGAYYTKEDITGYITRNSLLPFVLSKAAEQCAVAFDPAGAVWGLLRENPDRYIYAAVLKGADVPLPADIEAGIADVSKRTSWNRPAAEGFALPTETWREHVARRQRCHALRAKLAAGEVTTANDLVTNNLDIVRFVTDAVVGCEGPDLLRAFWQTLKSVSVLDPTCGSGAFLFAAMTILEPLYDACLDRMQQFVDEAAPNDPAGKRYKDFRDTLADVALHPGRRYFVLKQVAVNNLFGVDLMPEAVEICKLRLFLKLIAQVERAEDLEPLPDIDFNVRAGNTLVGFATSADARRAVNLLNSADLDAIEADAADVERLCRLYRNFQTGYKSGQLALNFTKADLTARLDTLRGRLDRYLAASYGVPADGAAFEAWHASHRPFHWFVEFHGILAGGGFDVVVGNPPYVQLSEIKSYLIRDTDYTTKSCGNLYAPVLERCAVLTRTQSRQGYIVPVSSVSTDGYGALQRVLSRYSLWYSSFDDRPSRLFDGLEHIRLTIHLIAPRVGSHLTSSRYNKWNKDERETLFSTLALTPSQPSPVPGSYAKLYQKSEFNLLAKLASQKSTLADSVTSRGEGVVYYTRKLGYFVQILDFIPELRTGAGQLREPSELKAIHFSTHRHAKVALCCLNSSLFYWFVTVVSDCRNLNKREVEGFPINLAAISAGLSAEYLESLADQLMTSLRATSEHRLMKSKREPLTVQCIIPKHSKPIIDRIDAALAAHYGFTPEELDFIQNYDIKYRLGADASGGDDDA